MYSPSGSAADCPCAGLDKALDEFMTREPCLANITHHWNQRGGYIGEAFGTLCQHSTYWSFEDERIHTGLEAMQVQGLPMWPFGRRCHASAIQHVCRQLKTHELRSLAGKSINACVAASLTAWILAHYELDAHQDVE